MSLGPLVRNYLAKKKRGGGPVRKADGGELSDADLAAMSPETYVNPLAKGMIHGLVTLPRRAIENSQRSLDTGDYDPGPTLEAAMLPMGTGAIAGVPVRGAETVLGSGAIRGKAPIERGTIDAGPAAEAGVDVRPGLAGPSGGTEGVRAAELQAQRWAGERQPLPGLPQGAQIVEGKPFIPGPVAKAHDVAERYMSDKDFGVPHPEKYHPIDVEHAKDIAKAFDEMAHAPNDPKVKAAYQALADETLAQYNAIVEHGGLKVTPVNGADYPYHGNPRAVVKDVADNNHMAFFKTDEGFGSSPVELAEHPFLKSSGVKVGDHDMLYNDLFRVVHDYFGHVKNGNGFRGAGEDNAWRAHAAMYSPEARRAMTTETRGQNSWLNYGPHGDFNRTASAADTIYAPQKIGLLPDWVMADRAPAAAPAKAGPRYFEGAPTTNAGVDAPPNRRIQTVADPYRMMFPGVYRNPKLIAQEAASRVGAEDPAMKQLFGVTRGDLRDMAVGRVGNEEPSLSLAGNPRGSLAAQNIQTPRNTQRLIDTLSEAGKHEGLRTADAWYIMDPVYKRLEQMFGPEEAARRYRHLNTTTAMASPGSDVLSEIQRGTAAHWLQNQGRFDDFIKYGGLTSDVKSKMKNVPRDVRYLSGHPYHRTAQGDPMQKYFDAGSIQSEAPKVPLYAHASGVPQTGFQTSGPVGDAHFSRGVGLADTRKGPTDVGSSFSRPEYQTLQPWWQHDVAAKAGLESVPAQARLWTAMGPQTGVESALGAPKLELLAKQIMKASRRLGVSPETARDLILAGKAGAGATAGAIVAPRFFQSGEDEQYAEGGGVGDDYNTPVPDEAAFQAWKAINTPQDTGVDYDLRGAYLSNMQRADNGHMGDRFKKPNHPTFSDQSQYATGDQRARAGSWQGETFVPPAPRSFGGRTRYAEGGDVGDTDTMPTFDPAKLTAAQPREPTFDPAKLAAATAKPPGPMSAGDVASGVIANAPESAWQFAQDVVRPVTHPVETMTGMKNLALGLLEKSGAIGTIFPSAGGGHEQYADAMGKYLMDRYGGVEEAKRSIAKDPVGVLADASMILTGGGSAAARAPGMVGRAGEVMSKVGRAVDPVMAPVNAAKVGTKAVGELLTHTGATPLENAYRAGVEGGDAGEVFRGQMRGTSDMTEPVTMAKRGLEGYQAERGRNYREGMGDITSIDRQMNPLDRVLDFGKIDDAVNKTERYHRFGERDINQPAAEVRGKMMDEIESWKAEDPATYHTIEGMDALKKSLGKMMMKEQPGTPARAAASEIYNAVRKTIVEYDPKYAKVMKDYEMASGQVRELERAMSLGEKASADTALRKLQSIMRNNVNTNYGRRLELGKLLEENGATHLMAALSGQALNAWAPRGLGKLGAEAFGLAAAGHFISPVTLAAAPLMSPRLMGELAHGTGRTVGRVLKGTGSALSGIGGNRAAANTSYRLGRATNPYENGAVPPNPYAP